jgi:hypothetical protein
MARFRWRSPSYVAREAVNRAMPSLRAIGEYVVKDIKTNWSASSPSSPGSPPARVTGRLHRSIKYRIWKNQRGAGVVIYSDAPHALWLEYGTVRMASRPFMSLAMQRLRSKRYSMSQYVGWRVR